MGIFGSFWEIVGILWEQSACGMIADCFFFCRVAHAAPLHPRRCHRHFGTFGLCALYGVWLARLMWRNPSPRFRLLWRKPGFVLRHDCRIRGKPPPEPPRSSTHASSLLWEHSACKLLPQNSQKFPKTPKTPKSPKISQISQTPIWSFADATIKKGAAAYLRQPLEDLAVKT